jgi:hypothetical protein
MTKRHYILIRIVISIVTVAVFIGLIVNGYGWLPIAVFVTGAAVNLYLKYKGNQAGGVAPDYMPPERELDDRRRS